MNSVLIFMELTDDDIADVEKFVRENTLSFAERQLKIKLGRDEILSNEKHLVNYFGDLYAYDPTNFRFEIGDKKTIKCVRDHIKKQVEKKGQKYLRRFRGKTVKMKQQNTALDQMAKIDNQMGGDIGDQEKNEIVPMDLQLLSVELVQKLKKYLHRHFEIQESAIQQIDQNTVNVKSTASQIVAEIHCIFCENGGIKRVFYKKERKYWVLSNYGQHLTSAHKMKRNSRNANPHELFLDEDTNDADIEIKNENDVEKTQHLEIEVVDVPLSTPNMPNLETNEDRLLFDQISAQISKVYETSLSQNALLEEVPFKLSDDESHLLLVTPMPKDGSCLFHSIAHQLFTHNASNAEHKRAAKKLRTDVVKHIKTNYSSFKQELQGRVYETVNEDQIENMNEECLFILNECLPNSDFYGGAETVKAVRELYRVNILIFVEEGTCYFSNGFNATFERTLVLAFRLNPNRTEEHEEFHNHYDSVCDISSEELLNSFNFLSQILKNANMNFDQTL